MQFTFLGTSSGVPTLLRNVSGLALRGINRKEWCLVDCGEATQHQLLRTGYSLDKLRGIFITHVHGDHSFGLPGLLASASMNGRSHPLKIVAPLPLKNFIESTIKTTQINLGYELEFVDVSGLSGTIEIAGFSVARYALSHRVPSFAYEFLQSTIHNNLKIEKLKQENIEPGPIWGLLQAGQDVTLNDGDGKKVLRSEDYLDKQEIRKSVLVCGDNDTPQLLSCAEKPDVLIHEATYDELVLNKIGSSHQHTSAARIAAYAQGAEIANLVLTHFSPRYQDIGSKEGNKEAQNETSIYSLEQEAREHYRNTLYLAKDYDTYILGRDGQLSLDQRL